MIKVSGSIGAKQVLRLSSGEYMLKPGEFLIIKKYREVDIKFLHGIGLRVENMESQSTQITIKRKPPELPKGAKIVEKQPEPKARSVLSSTELRREIESKTNVVKTVQPLKPLAEKKSVSEVKTAQPLKPPIEKKSISEVKVSESLGDVSDSAILKTRVKRENRIPRERTSRRKKTK
jgi:hypothetical protein